MAFKIFLDANIILDFTLQRDTGYDDAKKIVQGAIDRKFSAYITPAIVHIAGYYLTRAYKAETAKKILLFLLNDIAIIDISHTITLQALGSTLFDIEDSLQYYSALHHRLDYFISRDKPLLKFNSEELPIIHPKDFIKRFID
jgi:predicted nucleic acid-binding protein